MTPYPILSKNIIIVLARGILENRRKTIAHFMNSWYTEMYNTMVRQKKMGYGGIVAMITQTFVRLA